MRRRFDLSPADGLTSMEVWMEYDEDAGSISFHKVKDADMDNVRLRVARALAGRAGT